MAGIWDIGDGPPYDIVDAKLFARTPGGGFGPLIDIPSIDQLTLRTNNKSQTGRGDGRITAVASAVESANVTFRNLSIVQQILEAITGSPTYLYGTTPDQVRHMMVGSGRFKWFGIIGQALNGDLGDTHVFIPYMKIMEQFEMNFAYNEFVAPQITAMALGDPVIVDSFGLPAVYGIYEHETATALVVPPVLPALP